MRHVVHERGQVRIVDADSARIDLLGEQSAPPDDEALLQQIEQLSEEDAQRLLAQDDNRSDPS